MGKCNVFKFVFIGPVCLYVNLIKFKLDLGLINGPVVGFEIHFLIFYFYLRIRKTIF